MGEESMKHQQLFFSVLLVCFAFCNQMLADNQSSNIASDETDEIIQAISVAVRNIEDISRQQKIEINSRIKQLQALQTKIDIALSEMDRLNAGQKKLLDQNQLGEEAIDESRARTKAARENIKKILQILEEMQVTEDKLLAATQADNNAQKARLALTSISQDRTKAAKLLETIKNNDRTGATQIIDFSAASGSAAGVGSGTPALGGASASAGTGTGSVVEAGGSAGVASSTTFIGVAPGKVSAVEITSNADGAKIVFQIGTLALCLSTKNQCSGKPATVSK